MHLKNAHQHVHILKSYSIFLKHTPAYRRSLHPSGFFWWLMENLIHESLFLRRAAGYEMKEILGRNNVHISLKEVYFYLTNTNAKFKQSLKYHEIYQVSN